MNEWTFDDVPTCSWFETTTFIYYAHARTGVSSALRPGHDVILGLTWRSDPLYVNNADVVS
jgi:hypothetical protein